MSLPEPQIDLTVEVDPPYVNLIAVELLEEVADRVLHYEDVDGPIELAVWITNEDELQTLNRTYRGLDSTTDVLSFGTVEDELPFFNAPDAPRHLGDIAISYPHVVRQAEQFGHSRQRELAWLFAHGILHLLGYDDELPEDLRVMQERETAALGGIALDPSEAPPRQDPPSGSTFDP